MSGFGQNNLMIILPKLGEYGKARGFITLLIHYIMCGRPVNPPQLIFNNIITDNFEYRNLSYGKVLTIFLTIGVLTFQWRLSSLLQDFFIIIS